MQMLVDFSLQKLNDLEFDSYKFQFFIVNNEVCLALSLSHHALKCPIQTNFVHMFYQDPAPLQDASPSLSQEELPWLSVMIHKGYMHFPIQRWSQEFRPLGCFCIHLQRFPSRFREEGRRRYNPPMVCKTTHVYQWIQVRTLDLSRCPWPDQLSPSSYMPSQLLKTLEVVQFISCQTHYPLHTKIY